MSSLLRRFSRRDRPEKRGPQEHSSVNKPEAELNKRLSITLSVSDQDSSLLHVDHDPALGDLGPFPTYASCTTLLHPSSVTCMALSPTGRNLVVGAGAKVIVWDHRQGRQLASDTSKGGDPIVCVAVNDIKPRFAYGTQNGSIAVFDYAAQRSKEIVHSNNQPVHAIQYRHASIIGFCGKKHPTMRCWTDREGADQPELDQNFLEGFPLSFTASAFSASRRLLVVGHKTGGISFWQSFTGKADRTPLGQPLPNSANFTRCMSLAISPNNDMVAVCYGNGEIKVWDVEFGTFRVFRQASQEYPNPFMGMHLPIAFSSDGCQLVYCSSRAKTIVVHDVESQKVVAVHTLHACPTEDIMTILMSPDDSKIFLSFKGSAEVLVFRWKSKPWPSARQPGLFRRLSTTKRRV